MSKKKPMIEYLEIDQNIYIENDIVKSRLNENTNCEEYISHDELWGRIYKAMLKIKEYDEEKKNRND